MKEFKFLKFLDKFRGMYNKIGVDYDKMRAILSMKMTLDSRKVSTVMGGSNQSNKKEPKNSFTMTLLIYAIMGLFIGMTTMTPFNNMYKFGMTFGMFMFFILTIFITDFSTVLLDVRDKNIIATKGVNNKTINAAKITHICFYIILTSLALSWLAIIGAFKASILIGIIFILEIIIIDIFMIVITALLYLVILRFFNGEKVKDIINFVQIALTIIMTISYQFLARMFDIIDFNIVYESKIWNILLPPMWFAAPLYAVDGGQINNIIIGLIVLAVVVPVIAVTLYIKNTTKFEDYLSKLNITKSNEKEKKRGLFYKLGRRMCSNNEERAVYDLSVSVIKREREFKLMVYPNLGFIIAFPLVLLFLFAVEIPANSGELPLLGSLSIYWFVIMIPTILISLQYSSNYKATWIYESSFISDKNNIFRGAYKGLVANLLLPIYLLECIIFTIVFGIKVVPVLIIVFEVLLIFIVIQHLICKNKLPFSIPFGQVNKSQNLIGFLLGMLILGAAAALNILAMFSIYTLTAYGIVLGIIIPLLWKKCIKS